MHSTDSSLDLQLLRALAKRRKHVWVPIALVTFFVSLCYGLFLMPQGFQAKVSIAFPQSTSLSSGLIGSLIGASASSANTKYVGIVKSSRLAREVEQKAHVQQLLNLPLAGDAVQTIKDGLTVDDNPRDGLMYITVQLPGPARLWPGAGRQRDRVKATVTTTASEYAKALRRYVAVSDVDKEAILLRASEDRLRKDRAAYDGAVKLLVDFVKTASVFPSEQSAAGTSGKSTDPQSARAHTSVLEALYTRRAQLETDIKSASAAIQAEDEQRRELVNNVESVPLEDPLLAQTRLSLFSKQSELDSLRVQLGSSHPMVENARQQVAVLKKQFERQRKAALSGRTSARAEAQAQLTAMQAGLDTVVQSTAKAENKAQMARESLADYEILHNNVEIALDTLKATVTNVAVLQLQTVSAKNRMTVVDDARPPRTGSPGLVMILAGSLFLTGVVLGSVVAYDYYRFAGSFEPA